MFSKRAMSSRYMEFPFTFQEITESRKVIVAPRIRGTQYSFSDCLRTTLTVLRNFQTQHQSCLMKSLGMPCVLNLNMAYHPAIRSPFVKHQYPTPIHPSSTSQTHITPSSSQYCKITRHYAYPQCNLVTALRVHWYTRG